MSESLVPARAWQSRASWGVEIGRVRLAVTRTREHHSHGPADDPSVAPRRGSPFAAGALAGVGAVALLVVGASAAPQPALSGRYLVSVPVPTAATRQLVRPARQPAVGRQPSRAVAAVTDRSFDAADEPHVARAMATGALQEWEDTWGQRRFLTAGPARVEGGRACRDLALLVRLAEGGSRVRSAQRCTDLSDLPGQANSTATTVSDESRGEQNGEDKQREGQDDR